ncbi:MAG: hypothetical protein O2943_08780 [Actinomycetota bacterium]|nr:hypothetical protein [Actinomycetota bacterium]
MLEFLVDKKLLNSGANQGLLAVTGLVREDPEPFGGLIGEWKGQGHG